MINFMIPTIARQWFYVSAAILITVILNSYIRASIKIPKHLDSKRSRTYISVVRNFVTVVLYGFLLHIIFLILGINITPLLASAGIIGIAVGFGAKSLIEDIISGVFLLSQKAIAIGDYVKIDDQDEGYVDSIGLRTLTLRDQTGAYHLIPNGGIKRVINYSQRENSVMVDIPVKSSEPIDTILKVLEDTLTLLQKDKTFADYMVPGSKIFGINSFSKGEIMTIRVNLITHQSKRWQVEEQYRYLVKKGFEKHKIRFA